MLSFVVGDGRLEPPQKPVPRLRPGWAPIRVRLAGICNTGRYDGGFRGG
jgi:hypothetical protein